MSKKKNKNEKDELYSEIESELYSIVNTIHTLYKKYQRGNLNKAFFQKSIKNCMNDLLKINFQLKEYKVQLSEFLNVMNFTEKYYDAIDIINTISDMDFSDFHNKKSGEDLQNKSISSSMLEIPGVTSQITSSFITLLDALKLNALDNKTITIRLFEDVKENLMKFPGLEIIQAKFESVYKNVLYNYSSFTKDNKFRSSIEDDIYKLYQEFQEKLNLRG